MRKFISIIVALSVALMVSGCADSRTWEGKKYPPYGIIDEYSQKSTHVCYEVSVGNIVWSILLVETIIVPVVLIGWYLYAPVRMKKSAQDNCGIDN